MREGQQGRPLCAGAQCLMGVSPAGCGSDCSGAPLLAPLYVACNLGFNIAALNLLRAAGVGGPADAPGDLAERHMLWMQIALPHASHSVDAELSLVFTSMFVVLCVSLQTQAVRSHSTRRGMSC